MIKVHDVFLYNNQKYEVIEVYETGYCEIKRLSSVGPIELIHKKDLKNFEKLIMG
ncbi:hypothetical protein J7E71_04255 [Mesobacillus foraminis]|uniref:hypothetical protein n=1 Tax=Mesobacillus foraminis TaxID=279826 RepID=UPI001BECAF26|nr:hypothetical protein [Mesobacillus foraminis]MBT2755167.1 hypothetical protein [Mesobacillus foraminis]